MPIYEYECKKCQHRFERIQKFSDPLVRRCPACRTGRVRKLLSPPAVHFKGTGWYVTDYARKGSRDDSGKGAGDSQGKDGKDGKESDSKTAGKKSAAKPDSTGKNGK